MNELRHDLIYRWQSVDIEGIPQLLEDRRSDLEVHGGHYIDRFIAAKRRLQVSSLKDNPASIKRAQEGENFGYALFADWESGSDYHVDVPRTTGVGEMAFYGLLCIRLDFCKRIRNELGSYKDADKLSQALDKIMKGFTINPFEVICPHWGTFFFEPNFETVGEKGEATTAQLLKLYPDDDDLRKYLTSGTLYEQNSDYTEQVAVYHLETRGFIYDVVGRPMSPGGGYGLQTRPNVVGRPWYVFAPGRLMPETAPCERYRPLIAPIYPVVEKLRILGTLLNSGALSEGRAGLQLVSDGKQGAANIFSYFQMPAEERPVLELNLSDSAIQNPPAGYHYELMPIPPKDVIQNAYNNQMQLLDRYGFPQPLSPDQSLTGQASSGHLATREIEQANFAINPGLTNLANADKGCFILAGDIIRELDLHVTIPVFKQAQGSRVRELVTVGKEHFADIDIALDLDGATASMDFAMKESDRVDLEKGLMSRQAYMTKWNEDPLAEDTRISQEKMSIPIDDMAINAVLTFIEANAQPLVNNAAAKLGVNIPTPPPAPPSAPPPAQPTQAGGPPEGVIPQSGGPEKPGGVRRHRPPTGSFPGLGATTNPEVQSNAMEQMPV